MTSGLSPPRCRARPARECADALWPLRSIHAPVIYILGGPADIANSNAMDDFTRIARVPAAAANLAVGHGARSSSRTAAPSPWP